LSNNNEISYSVILPNFWQLNRPLACVSGQKAKGDRDPSSLAAWRVGPRASDFRAGNDALIDAMCGYATPKTQREFLLALAHQTRVAATQSAIVKGTTVGVDNLKVPHNLSKKLRKLQYHLLVVSVGKKLKKMCCLGIVV
jgi:hypothetical protein